MHRRMQLSCVLVRNDWAGIVFGCALFAIIDCEVVRGSKQLFWIVGNACWVLLRIRVV